MRAVRRKISPKKCQKCQKNGGKGSAGANQRTGAVGNPHPRHGSVHAPERVTSGTNRRTGPWETRVHGVKPGGDGHHVVDGSHGKPAFAALSRGVTGVSLVSTHRNVSPVAPTRGRGHGKPASAALSREVMDITRRPCNATRHQPEDGSCGKPASASRQRPHTGTRHRWHQPEDGSRGKPASTALSRGVTGVLPASTHQNVSPAAPTRGQVHGKPVSTVLSREVMDITRCPRTAPRHRCAQHPSPKQAGTAYRGSTRRPGRATPRAGR